MKVMDNLEDQRSQEWPSIIYTTELSIRKATRKHIRDGADQRFLLMWEEIGSVLLLCPHCVPGSILSLEISLEIELEINLEINYPNAIQSIPIIYSGWCPYSIRITGNLSLTIWNTM